MQVNVRLGAGLARLAGAPQLSVELLAGATVADLLSELERTHPTMAPGVERALLVVHGNHAARGDALADGQEIALLLPAAGG